MAGSAAASAPAASAAACRRGGVPLLICAALLVRLLVGQHTYSGFSGNRGVSYGTYAPDMSENLGDYEAQRHWMEVGLALPAADWYTYDLGYWGVDYPPLSMYQSVIHGHMMRSGLLGAEDGNAAVALVHSRGYESRSSKRGMRLSVLLSEVLLLWPVVIMCARAIAPGDDAAPRYGATRRWGNGTFAVLACVLLQPGLILIDHGHFQYNSISLGLTAAAFLLITRYDLDCAGSVLFTLAMAHKHMSLYYALAFFGHLCGKAAENHISGAQRKSGLPPPPTMRFARFLIKVLKLGATVVLTLVLVLAPWILEGMRVSSAAPVLQVFRRLFPLQRGIFEDYVANFWCTTSPVLKWKLLLPSSQALATLCATVTLVACVPSTVHQMLRPSPTGLLLGMFNASLAFFLFSYQVHEKGILYPLLPASLLIWRYPNEMVTFTVAAALSMAPLLLKDGLLFALVGTLLAYAGVLTFVNPSDGDGTGCGRRPWTRQALDRILVCITVATVALKVCLPPPPSLPYLYDLFISASCFLVFCCTFVSMNVEQWLTH